VADPPDEDVDVVHAPLCIRMSALDLDLALERSRLVGHDEEVVCRHLPQDESGDYADGAEHHCRNRESLQGWAQRLRVRAPSTSTTVPLT
jgi:hypothetical protein